MWPTLWNKNTQILTLGNILIYFKTTKGSKILNMYLLIYPCNIHISDRRNGKELMKYMDSNTRGVCHRGYPLYGTLHICLLFIYIFHYIRSAWVHMMYSRHIKTMWLISPWQLWPKIDYILLLWLAFKCFISLPT